MCVSKNKAFWYGDCSRPVFFTKERERIKSIYDVSSLARDVMAQLLHLSLFGVGANYWTHYTGLAGCFLLRLFVAAFPCLITFCPPAPTKQELILHIHSLILLLLLGGHGCCKRCTSP